MKIKLPLFVLVVSCLVARNLNAASPPEPLRVVSGSLCGGAFTVVFDQSVDPESSTDMFNYTGLDVEHVCLNGDGRSVTVLLNGIQLTNTTYCINVTGIRSLDGLPMDPSSWTVCSTPTNDCSTPTTQEVVLNPGWNLFVIQLVNEVGQNIFGTRDGTDSITFLNVPGAKLRAHGRTYDYSHAEIWCCGDPIVLNPGDEVFFYNPEDFATPIALFGRKICPSETTNAWGAVVRSPVSLYVTDPIGRSLGMPCFDSPLGEEIPNVEAARDAEELKGFWIPNAIDGRYNLYLCGTGNGHYELDFLFSDTSGQFSRTIIDGEITANEAQLVLIDISITPSGETVVGLTRPPICNAGGPYTAECAGASTSVLLHGSGSSDPNGSSLTYAWSSDCPAAPFSDPTSPTPTLTFNSSQVPEGCNVTLTVRNAFGLNSTCSSTVTLRDTIAPSITCPADIIIPCSVESLVPVNFVVTATDHCDPAPTVSCVPASGAGFPVGMTTVICAANDARGNTSSCSFKVTRPALAFEGFLPPIGGADATGGSFAGPIRTFKIGSTIPVKFMASCEGAAVLSGAHNLQAIKYTDVTTADQPIDATPQDAATTGNQFRLTDGKWHFNLDTRSTGMSVGKWQLIATLSDGSQHSVWIQLR